MSVCPSEISTQLLGTLTHPLVLANPASESTSPNSLFTSCLSLTIAFPWLSLTPLCSALGLCLSSSSSTLVGNLMCKPFVWALRQNRQRNPLTGAHPHPHNECSLSYHNYLSDVYYFDYDCLVCCPHLYWVKLKHNDLGTVFSSLLQVSLVYLSIEMIQPV